MSRVEVTRLVRDEGTVVVFEGVGTEPGVDRGKRLTFAVDHRPARDLAAALEDPDEEVFAEIEPWQILTS